MKMLYVINFRSHKTKCPICDAVSKKGIFEISEKDYLNFVDHTKTWHNNCKCVLHVIKEVELVKEEPQTTEKVKETDSFTKILEEKTQKITFEDTVYGLRSEITQEKLLKDKEKDEQFWIKSAFSRTKALFAEHTTQNPQLLDEDYKKQLSIMLTEHLHGTR